MLMVRACHIYYVFLLSAFIYVIIRLISLARGRAVIWLNTNDVYINIKQSKTNSYAHNRGHAHPDTNKAISKNRLYWLEYDFEKNFFSIFRRETYAAEYTAIGLFY